MQLMPDESDEIGGKLNLEQQYRTGRFPVMDADQPWIHQRVHDLLEKDQQGDWVLIIARARELLRDTATRQSAVAQALAVLGLNAPIPNLVAHTRACVETQPEREAELWEAMWALRSGAWSDGEFRQLLPSYAKALEERMRYREAGWPESWWGDFADLWHELGGTPQSAHAWDNAGWMPSEILTAHITIATRYVSIRSRAQLLHPPKRTDAGVSLRNPQSIHSSSASNRRP